MLKSKIITRYLVKHLLYRFFIITFGILLLVYIITFVEMMRKIDNNDTLNIFDIAYLSFSQLPPVIDKIFPFLILLSSLWSIFTLLKTSELTILKASSISLWRISCLYFFTTFILTITYIFTIMPFLAHLHHNYRLWEKNQMGIIYDIHKKNTSNNNQIIFLSAEQFDTKHQTLSNIHITVLDNNHLLEKIYYAENALYRKTDKMIVFNTIKLLKTNTPILESEMEIKNFTLKFNLNSIQSVNDGKQEITSLYAYPSLIATQKEQKLSANNLYILFYSLLILPLTCGIYAFLGVVAVPALYRGIKGIKNILIALLAGLLFYMLDSWVIVVAGNGTLPVLIALLTVKIPVILLCIMIIFNKEYGFMPKNPKKITL